jgi:hypothetical protein
MSTGRIKEAIRAGFSDQRGYVAYSVLAWAEFDPDPFLTGGNILAPRNPADYHQHRFGVWDVLNRLDGGGRLAIMALGTEAMGSISALYPATPPEWLILGDNNQFEHPLGHYEPLGEDLAVESMHGDWRVINYLCGE